MVPECFAVVFREANSSSSDLGGESSAGPKGEDNSCRFSFAPTAAEAIEKCLGELVAHDADSTLPRHLCAAVVRCSFSSRTGIPESQRGLALELCRCGHVGQILLCADTAERLRQHPTVRYSTVPIGEHILSQDLPPLELYSLKVAGRDHAFPPIRSRSTINHNLPSRGLPFIGRSSETAEVIESLESSIITNLVGPRGVGKSALAWRAAIEWLGLAHGSAWLVRVHEGSTLETLQADLLNAAAPKSLAGAEMRAALGDSRHLVLLDGCDASKEVSIAMVRLLQQVGDGLAVICTSREELSIPDARQIDVGPMALPSLKGSTDDLMDSESVRLFLSCYETLGGSLDAESLADIARIVHWVHGMPSDIIASATQSAAYGLDIVAGHFRPRRSTSPRHSLNPTPFELDADASRLLARLSVLCPTWNTRAAHAISGLSHDQTNALLRQLSDAGLLEAGYFPGREIRFHTTGSATLFGLHQLDPVERISAEASHIRHFLAVAEDAVRMAIDVESEINSIQTEYSNIRLALSRAIYARSRDAAAFLYPLARFWHRRRPVHEALSLCRAVCELETIEESDHAATAFNVAGTFLSACGFLAESAKAHERSLTIAEIRHDDLTAGLAQSNLVSVYLQLGDLASAVSAGHASVERLAGEGDPARLARALNNLTTVLHEIGEFEAAHASASQALSLSRDLGDSWLECHCLGNLAEIALDAGKTQQALAVFIEELKLGMFIVDPRAVALALEGIGRIEVRAENWKRASWLLRFADAYRSEHELHMSDKLIAQYESLRQISSKMARDNVDEAFDSEATLSKIAGMYFGL